MEPSPPEDDRNSAQLEVIFRTHVADLYRYIYRQVHQAVIAEDLTSSVFLKATRWLRQERGPESVKGWLYATARSVIADYWREQAQINLLPLETAEEIPAFSPEGNEEQQQLLQTSIYRLLDGLPSRERDVLTLRYFQGYSAAEIGQALGLSANYVRVLQLRALRHAASLETTERIIPMESPAIPYNQHALRVLELAKEEARTLNHNAIGTEHLLLGILDEGSAATELINHGLTAERLRGAIVYIVERSSALPGDTQETGYTPRTQAVFALAVEEARRMGETAISPHHLLIAILREGEGIAAAVLQGSGVRLKQVGDTVRINIDTQNNPFTPRALKVLEQAEIEARHYNHPSVDTGHILLGIGHENECVAAKALERLQVQLSEMRAQIEKQHPAGDQPVTGQMKMAASMTASIKLAVQEARSLVHHYLGTEHLLLGMLHEEEGLGGQVLRGAGVTLEKAREVIKQLLDSAQPGSTSEPE